MAKRRRIKAIAPWFGGKRTMAADIVAELGPHTQYFEGCCGSMAVTFEKPRSQKETVCDKHGDLINLARVLQEEPYAVQLYERAQRTLFVEDTLHRAQHELAGEIQLPEWGIVTPEMLERAYWFFVASWMGRNGTAGTARVDYQLAVRWTGDGGSPTVRWRNVTESIPWWHDRLRDVVILHRDMFDIIHRFEDIRGTVVYVDPPYFADTRSGFRFGPGSDHKYLHEFNHGRPSNGNGHRSLFDDGDDEPNDHVRLRDALAAYEHARIVVSYYDCPFIRDLYDGWTFREMYRQKNLHAAYTRGESGVKEAPEVLIINGPSNATDGNQ